MEDYKRSIHNLFNIQYYFIIIIMKYNILLEMDEFFKQKEHKEYLRSQFKYD